MKHFLKERGYYDSHVLSPEGLKIIKLSQKDYKLNSLDVSLFRLKQYFKEFMQIQKDILILKDNIIEHLVLNNRSSFT